MARAMDPGGTVLVLETVLPEGDAPHPGKLLDVVMLTLVRGRERTEREYAVLFDRAGLVLDRIVPTAAPTSVVVARRRV